MKAAGAIAIILVIGLAAGCGNENGNGCVPASGLSVDRDRVSLDYWEGDTVEARIALSGAGDRCAVLLSTDQPWLAASVTDDATEVVITITPESLVSGVHQGRVDLSAGAADNPLASVAVELHALVRARPDAPRRVLFVGVDGLRADGLAAGVTPNISRLIAHGAWSLHASTQLEAPTVSGPGWASILYGVDADKHGIVSNDNLQLIRAYPYPTFLQRALDAGYATKIIVQWVGILPLVEPAVRVGALVGDGAGVSAMAHDELAAGDIEVLFLHFDDVDHAGHATGFDPNNPEYLAAVASVDDHVGDLIEGILARPAVADEEWLIALSSDHGGAGTGHGALDTANRTIPLILAGPSIVPHELADGASQLDAHPSVLDFLGVSPRPEWQLDGVGRLHCPLPHVSCR